MAEQNNNSFFERMRKLFSTNVIVRREDGKTKVVDTEGSQALSNLKTIKDRFYKLQTGYQYNALQTQLSYQTIRRELFLDYDAMDNDPIIASALDIYADESTTKNEFGDVLTIKTSNQNVKEVLHNLFYDIMNIEFNLWPWIRNLAKYGDQFLVLEIVEGEGVVNVFPQSVYHTQRTENPHDPSRINRHETGIKFTVDPDYLGKKEYDNYEMAHFRLYSDTNYLPYGKSMIENARRLWKQITLMEDAMMIHRIMRAPEKRIFKIDIGNIPPQEVDNYMQKIINKIKKTPFQDQRTGDYNLKYNMMNITEDFFMPVRGGDSGTQIDTLSGLNYSAVEDIDYLKAKLFAALKVPKAFLGYEEDINGKATLAAEDIRFARTIERIQRVVVSELTQVAIAHLIANGFEGMEAVDFSLELTNPSTIYEQEKINLWTEKVRLATDMKALKMISNDWIYKNIFKLSDDEIAENREDVVTDTFDLNRLTKIENEGVDPYEEQPQEEQPTEEPQPEQAPPMQPQPEAPQPEAPQNEGEAVVRDKSQTSAENGKEGGRPAEAGDSGTDENAFGRDPLGKDDITRNFGRETRKERLVSKLKNVSEKEKFLKDAIRKRIQSRYEKKSGKKVLNEDIDTQSDDSGSLLDDKNILTDI
ncbi:hypothetical protein EB169_03575 [archaeon]|nr:hypothetical protein [archaeon]